jgi:Ca2+-binding EF-hand superfamily protein
MISAEEIKEVLGFGKTLSEEAVNEIVKQVDANGDGEISFEEFANMMRKLSS